MVSPILERVFETVEEAVRAFRAAGAEHHRARDLRDYTEMRAANDRIRAASAALRGYGRADLIQPLTMEWVTEGRDAAEHERWGAEVDKLQKR